MKKDRLGLVLIAASLIAIAVVGALVYRSQQTQHRDSIRVNGTAIVRAVAGMEAAALDPLAQSGFDQAGMLRSLAAIRNDDSLSYLVVVDRAGNRLQEMVSPGSLVPAATMPVEAFAWFGEHELVSPADRAPIREFFAPVVRDGQLAGFVRAGYFDNHALLAGGQVPLLGLMALPIFLLTTLAYLLLRREMEPLRGFGEKLESIARSYGAEPPGEVLPRDADFAQRLDRFIQIMQSRVEHLALESTESQTLARLASYKQEKVEYALNHLPDAIVILDESGSPTFTNLKFEQLLDRSRDQLLGRPVQDWCGNRDVATFLLRHRPATASARSAVLEYTPENQPERRIRILSVPLFAPRDRSNPLGTLFMFRDVSSEHSARQVGSDFVSHAAHELKTPLNALLGYSELLLHRATLPEAEQVNAVNVIRSETERMATLINNLLSISKMESGALKPERSRVRLNDLIQDAFNHVQSSALDKQVQLELAVAPDLGSVRLDKDLFRIALDNLLGNAVKYSNPGGRVFVTVRVLDDGQVQIKVRDQGIGIPQEDCPRIFDKYFRSSNAGADARTGHGLGLYLARQIIELHQGTIAVHSQLHVGTEFTVTLKVQPAHLELAEAV